MGFFWRNVGETVINLKIHSFLRRGNVLVTLLSIFGTSLLTLGLLAFYIRRTLPNILTKVGISAGETITEQLNENLKETFENPNVKRAMSILGKQSGNVRATKALREKAAEGFLAQSPVISKALQTIGITPLEGLQLLNDPMFGPMIQNAIGMFTEGLMKPSGNSGGGNQSYGGKM